MEQESIDRVSEQKVEEFCELTDWAVALDFAIATASQFHKHKTIREAWDSVEYILRYPLALDDDFHFSKIENSLDSRITVKLYKFYLKVLKENNVPPGYLMPERKLVELMHNAKYEESEFTEVFLLHRRILHAIPQIEEGNEPS